MGTKYCSESLLQALISDFSDHVVTPSRYKSNVIPKGECLKLISRPEQLRPEQYLIAATPHQHHSNRTPLAVLATQFHLPKDSNPPKTIKNAALMGDRQATNRSKSAPRLQSIDIIKKDWASVLNSTPAAIGLLGECMIASSTQNASLLLLHNPDLAYVLVSSKLN